MFPPLLLAVALGSAAEVTFNRDVRPILSEYCFACHGPDTAKRKAGLRLDTADGAKAAFVAGKPDHSEVFLRITGKGKLMPPAATNKTMKPAEIATVKAWIEQGAKYEPLWSFIAPKRSGPGGADAIDRLIRAKLAEAKLTPAAEADRRTLIRRLSFDLTGLPPTAAEVDAFVNDNGAKAYDDLVTRLLESKHFGERMALFWLDLVRFADTAGYHSDNHRDIHLYRDYVIDAFNDNKPFDRFVVEQLAGDLLPKVTRETRVASGYNRLLQTTEEGGAQPKEYTAKYAADRVRNAGSVFLGLTLGCAECHAHKYDPVTAKEFYAFASFWADVSETAVGRQSQTLLPSAEQEKELRRLDELLAAAKKELEADTPAVVEARKAWAAKAKADKGLPKNVAAALSAEKPTPAQLAAIAAHHRKVAPELSAQRKTLDDLTAKKKAVEAKIPTTLVTTPTAPRTMRLLPRGNWLDDTGELVAPGVPASLPALKFEGRRANRLDLARWMVAPENPLVARVFVNRVWRLLFGQGIVTSMEDFGSQGAWPSHPELLDELAVDFRESGWDVKALVRKMVTSATYRQVSVASEAAKKADPYNRLLARQGRWRHDAETVRDNALAVSGLLVRKIGGPSVKPYQPAGYWAYLNFPTRTYVEDRGEDQYRRGVYTYWQRSFPHPSLIAFDAPSREECTADRPRSNTPQQALVLLNDPTYVEAARALAEGVLKSPAKTDGERLSAAFRTVLGRGPTARESAVLLPLVAKHLEDYRADPKAADELLKVGQKPAGKDVDRPSLAAWTTAARVLLNLHESISRE